MHKYLCRVQSNELQPGFIGWNTSKCKLAWVRTVWSDLGFPERWKFCFSAERSAFIKSVKWHNEYYQSSVVSNFKDLRNLEISWMPFFIQGYLRVLAFTNAANIYTALHVHLCLSLHRISPAEYGKSRRDLACAYPFLAAFTACNTKQKSGTRACMVDGVCLLAWQLPCAVLLLACVMGIKKKETRACTCHTLQTGRQILWKLITCRNIISCCFSFIFPASESCRKWWIQWNNGGDIRLQPETYSIK